MAASSVKPMLDATAAVATADPEVARAAFLKALDPQWGGDLAHETRPREDNAIWVTGIDVLSERDLPQWGVRVPSTALRRYLDLLTDAFLVRQLQPWHANLRKRQVKSPKVYVRDSGVLHTLLSIATAKDLMSHPKVGVSWEGFIIEQLLLTEPHDEAFFWVTHQGAEIDLILRRGGRLLAVECKRTDAPKVTPSIRNGLTDLGLERVAIVYPGERRYPLTGAVEAVPASELAATGRLFGESGAWDERSGDQS